MRVSRAAADQRRGRAGRTEPGVCYRLWDEPQTASLEPYARPEILAADLSSFVLDLAAWGAAPETLAFLDPPPKAGARRGAALLARARRARRRWPHHRRRPARCGACRCRRGSPAWWSMPRREGAGRAGRRHRRDASTERGLGGDDVDLAASPRRFPPRPLAPRRARRARWRSGGRRSRRRRREPREGEAMPGVGAILALAYPERIAKNRGAGGAFLLVNGRGANVDAASPLAREPLPRGRRNDRQRRAGPHPAGCADHACRDRGALRRSHRGTRRGRRSMRRARACARGAAGGSGAIALAEQPMRGRAERRDGARCSRDGVARAWHRAVALDASRCRQWRDRVMFLRAREGDEWPDLSDAALAANRERMARAGARRQDRARSNSRPTNLTSARARPAALAAASGGSTPRRRRISKRRRARRADRLRGGRRAEACDPRAGIVRPRPASGDRRRQGSAGDRAAVARRTGRCR